MMRPPETRILLQLQINNNLKTGTAKDIDYNSHS
jgi:hypothetical protein